MAPVFRSEAEEQGRSSAAGEAWHSTPKRGGGKQGGGRGGKVGERARASSLSGWIERDGENRAGAELATAKASGDVAKRKERSPNEDEKEAKRATEKNMYIGENEDEVEEREGNKTMIENKEISLMDIWRKLEEVAEGMKREIREVKDGMENRWIEIEEKIERNKREEELKRKEQEKRLEEEIKNEGIERKKECKEMQERAEENWKNIKKELEEMKKNTEREKERARREKRKKNIIIGGLEGGEGKGKEKIEEWMEKRLGAKVKVKNTWEIKGRKGDLTGVELYEESEKELIMAKKNKLAGSRIYIKRDKTWKEREIERKVWERAEKLKKEGIQARVRGNRVITEKEEWKWDEDKEDFQSIKRTTEKENGKEKKTEGQK